MQFRRSINIPIKNCYYDELRLTGPLLSFLSPTRSVENYEKNNQVMPVVTEV